MKTMGSAIANIDKWYDEPSGYVCRLCSQKTSLCWEQCFCAVNYRTFFLILPWSC